MKSKQWQTKMIAFSSAFVFLSMLFVATTTMATSCRHNKKKTNNNQQSNQNSTQTGNESVLKDVNLKTFTIKGQDAKSGTVVFSEDSITITKDDVKLEFAEADAPKNFILQPELPLTLQAPVEKEVTISTKATDKYKAFQKKITIKCTKQLIAQALTIKTLTVHGVPVGADGKVSVKQTFAKVEAKDVQLTFNQSDAPTPSFAGLPLTLEIGKNVSFTISTTATQKYTAFSTTVTVTPVEKTVDECITALGNQLAWKDTVVSSDISLPTTVTGFADSTIGWKSSNAEYIDNKGKIGKKNIVNVPCEMEATVNWKGQTQTAKFTVTVARLKKIREAKKENVLGQPNVDCIYTIDLSTENTLKYSKKAGNGADTPICEFAIESVNTTNGGLVAKLTKFADHGSPQTLDEIIQEKLNKFFSKIDKEFNPEYFKLKKNDNPQWDDIKAYLLARGVVTNDDDNDAMFARFKQDSRYTGNWASFVALSAEQKKTHITKMLKDIKTPHCLNTGVPVNTADDKLVASLKEALRKKESIPLKHKGKTWKYTYTLTQTNETTRWLDGYSFEAKSIFDASKQWYDQLGSYAFDHGGNRISTLDAKEDRGAMLVEGKVGTVPDSDFKGIVQASQGAFEVSSVGDPNDKFLITVGKPSSTGELTMNVNDNQNIRETVNLTFKPSGIFELIGQI